MQRKQVTISDITVTSKQPQVKDPAIAKLLPRNYLPEYLSFVVDGVNTAIANGLQKTICDELSVAAMYCPIANILSTDPHIIEEMLAKRFRMIPLDQKTPRNTKFSLDVINDTPWIRDVKSSEMKMKGSNGQKLPFNETFTLCTLAPGCLLTITDISVEEHYGYVKGNGMHAVAYGTASIPLDVMPFNPDLFYAKVKPTGYKPEDAGVPSREANPHKFRISFSTNGTMHAKRIVVAACDEIIRRVKAVEAMLDQITNGVIGATLTIPGEADTIGNLYMKTIIELYPGVDFAKYTVSKFERSVDIVVRFPDFDIKTLFIETSEHIIRTYEAISAKF